MKTPAPRTSAKRSETDRPERIADPVRKNEPQPPAVRPPPPWYKGIFVPALASGLLLWAAFPPLAWWPLAWVAPLGWLALVRVPQWPATRPYLKLWLAAFLHWAAMLQGLRLAHPALYVGWLALAAYLACYVVVFVALTRVAVHRLRISLVVAAPVVWVGLELARGHALTGFSMGLLGHTQIAWTTLIQVADLVGAYGVSFVLMLAAACLARTLPELLSPERPTDAARGPATAIALPPREPSSGPAEPRAQSAGMRCPPATREWTLWPMLVLAGVLAGVILYGLWRKADAGAAVQAWSSTAEPLPNASDVALISPAATGRPGPDSVTDEPRALRVALIQASFDTILEPDPERQVATFLRYRELSLEAMRQYRDLDLIVWPESAFSGTSGDVLVDAELGPPPEMKLPADEFRRLVYAAAAAFQEKARHTAALVNGAARDEARPPRAALLVGTDTTQVGPGELQRYNSALLIRPTGEVAERYYKMHRVPFGEFIPFGGWFPVLYRITPMPYGLAAGADPKIFPVAGVRLAPSICFESTVPHRIRQQVVALQRAGTPPDVLVNVTNDGWFWGSSILDFHLACAVFRAVEHRLPMLVAANTGLSVVIDADGGIRARGPRRAEQILVAEVRPQVGGSWYQRGGDLPAGLCLAFCLVVAVVGLTPRRARPKPAESME